jgi:catechol 2,3-dioxygenase-like lactoylglutathione lyase family enzyme
MLQHASLEVPPDRVRDCVAFWELLGFEEMEPPPKLGGRFTWVQREGTQIHFLFTDEPIVPQGGHVAVVADDFEATFARLADAGFSPEEHRRPWGAARAFTKTPGGHLVEFMAEPPVR